MLSANYIIFSSVRCSNITYYIQLYSKIAGKYPIYKFTCTLITTNPVKGFKYM